MMSYEIECKWNRHTELCKEKIAIVRSHKKNSRSSTRGRIS